MKAEFPIHYAYCTKYTPGELDRHPFSSYEMREQMATIELVWSEALGNEWRVSTGDRALACEDTIPEAVAMAAYKLMDESRELASKQTIIALK